MSTIEGFRRAEVSIQYGMLTVLIFAATLGRTKEQALLRGKFQIAVSSLGGWTAIDFGGRRDCCS